MAENSSRKVGATYEVMLAIASLESMAIIEIFDVGPFSGREETLVPDRSPARGQAGALSWPHVSAEEVCQLCLRLDDGDSDGVAEIRELRDPFGDPGEFVWTLFVVEW